VSQKKIRIWMLVYSIIFALLTIISIKDDIDSRYHKLYVFWGIIIYLLAIIGNICYVFNYSNDVIKKCWRVIAPIIVLYSIISCIIDKNFGAQKESINIITWLTVILILFPTFKANFILGYKKQYP
jgi:glucan phosphoethanolaminetransferase (alkaline phosphatase superfamily)